jgi:hypothetical protein
MSNKTAHTPGPWASVVVGEADDCEGNTRGVAEVHSANGEPIAEHLWAEDAVLCAAAPDLLAALIEARERLANQIGLTAADCIGGDFRNINAAIAKATSEAA